MNYPNAIDTFRTFVNLPGMTYNAAKTDIPFSEDLNKTNDSIKAIETELGLLPKGEYLNVATYLSELDIKVSSVYAAMSGIASTIFSLCYPIGTVYFNAIDNRNPAVILGFGTWVPHAVGRSIFGKAESGTFSTLGATGGVENVTLTAAQSGLPAHNHTLNLCSWGGDTASFASAANNSTIQRYGVTANTNALDASSSHTNLSPWEVDCVWERTA